MNFITKIMTGAALTAGMASCGLMHDDTPPCPTDPKVSTLVNFVYDYNMDGIDYFDRQAGSVYLYVFDSDGRYYMRREVHRVDLDPVNPDFSIHFDDTELVPGNTYEFVAVATANHKGTEAEDTPGFTLQTEMIPGSSRIEDYILKLDRNDDGTYDFGIVDYTDDYGNNVQMMDTLWTTKPNEVQRVTIPVKKAEFDSTVQLPDYTEEVTVPMMRITNQVTVGLNAAAFNENTKETDYNILIYFPEGNGHIGFTGDLMDAETRTPLMYRALRKEVREYTPHPETRADGDAETDGEKQYAIYATFGLSRLIEGDQSELRIYDGETDELVGKIENFSDYLANYGNTDYKDNQEYLDREFDFHVDFGLNEEGKAWWSQVRINILSWSVREWYTSL